VPGENNKSRSRLKRPVKRDQVTLPGEDGRLGTVGQPKLGEDARHPPHHLNR
jgi:hypothetical protein